MTINVSTVVDVSIAVAENFPARAGFGTLLFLTAETGVLAAPELTRLYNDIDSVADDWPADSEVVAAATAYFSQTPRPTTFKVGLCEGSAGAGGGANDDEATFNTNNIQNDSGSAIFSNTDSTVEGDGNSPEWFTVPVSDIDLSALPEGNYFWQWTVESVGGGVALGVFADDDDSDSPVGGFPGVGYGYENTGNRNQNGVNFNGPNLSPYVDGDVIGARWVVTGAGARTLAMYRNGVVEGTPVLLQNTVNFRIGVSIRGVAKVSIQALASTVDNIPANTTAIVTVADDGAQNTATVTGLDACLSLINDFDDDWYGLVLSKEMRDDTTEMLAVASWIEARTKVFGHTTNNPDVLDGTITDDVATQLSESNFRRTMTTYSSSVDSYPSASILARAFTVNFNQPDSTITLMFKTGPGIPTENITGNQRNIARGKNVNGFFRIGDKTFYDDSSMSNGSFFDELHGLDWLQNAIQTTVCGYLLSRTTKVPYTDRGVAMLEQQLRGVLDEAVRNGLIAPGTTVDGEYLANGYSVNAIPVAEINQSDVDARFYPGLSFVLLGAGAIHRVQINGVFER